MATGLPGLPPPGFATQQQQQPMGLPGLPPPGFASQKQEPLTMRQELAGLAGAVGQGVTFGFADEIAAGIRSVLPQYQDYDSELAAIRAGQEQYADQRPVVNFAGNLAGGVVLPLGGLAKGAGLASKLTSAAKVGAGTGALYGFGSAEGGMQNRIDAAEQGALIGGVASPLLVGGVEAVRGVAKIPGAIQRNFTAAGQENAAKESARKILSSELDIPAVTKALEQFNKGPKDKLTPFVMTAEATQNPKIASLQQALSKMGVIDDAVYQVGQKRESARQALAQQLIPESMTPEVAGTTVRGGIADNLERAQAEVSKLAEKAFKGGENLRTFPAKAAVSDALNEFTGSGARSVNGEFQKLVDNFRSLPARTDLKVLQDYRSAFGKFAGGGGMGASPTDKMTAEAAGRLRSAIDTSIETAVARGELPKAQANAYRKMINVRRALGETFESGPVGKMLQKEPFGAGFKVDSSEVVRKAIGTPEDARALMKAIGPQIPAKGAARTAVIQDIIERSSNPKNGEFVPSKFAKQMEIMRGVDEEILTPKQIKVLQRIKDDLVSEDSARGLAYSASKGNSITAQAVSGIDALQAAIAGYANPAVSLVSPRLSRVVNLVYSTVKDSKTAESLIKRELAELVLSPVKAEAFLKSAPLKAHQRLFDTLAQRLSAKIPPTAGLVGSELSQPDDQRGDTATGQVAPARPAISRVEAPSPKGTPLPSGNSSLSPLLDAIRMVESSGGKFLEGPKTKYGTAKGPYQILDSTGKEYHKKLGIQEPYDPYNEEQSRLIAEAIITDYARQFGSLEKGILAYHTGPGNVKKGIIGPQGRAYVPKIIKALEALA